MIVPFSFRPTLKVSAISVMRKQSENQMDRIVEALNWGPMEARLRRGDEKEAVGD